MKPNDRWMGWVVAESAAQTQPMPFARGTRPMRRAVAGAAPTLRAIPVLPRPKLRLALQPVRVALPV